MLACIYLCVLTEDSGETPAEQSFWLNLSLIVARPRPQMLLICCGIHSPHQQCKVELWKSMIQHMSPAAGTWPHSQLPQAPVCIGSKGRRNGTAIVSHLVVRMAFASPVPHAHLAPPAPLGPSPITPWRIRTEPIARTGTGSLTCRGKDTHWILILSLFSFPCPCSLAFSPDSVVSRCLPERWHFSWTCYFCPTFPFWPSLVIQLNTV